MLTFGSLFAGIGGFDLGLERAGMVCKWQVEIDPFCQQVLAKHWPDVERFGDVKDCGKHNLATVDLIAGGFPCQPHSVAGQQRGAEDDRDLWPEYRRIIAELRPTWVLAENVPGIKRTMLDEVLSDLEDLAYQTRTLIVPACAFNAPHRRERVFIVAYAQKHDAGQLGEQPNNQREKKTDQARRIGLRPQLGGCSQNMAYTVRQRCNGWSGTQETTEPPGWFSPEGNNPWTIEPGVDRMAHGVPNRVDRVTALGDAVVPQVAEWIGQRIVEVSTLV